MSVASTYSERAAVMASSSTLIFDAEVLRDDLAAIDKDILRLRAERNQLPPEAQSKHDAALVKLYETRQEIVSQLVSPTLC